MPIIECTMWLIGNYKNSYVVETCLIRSQKPLVFGKSICKTIEHKTEAMDGHNMLKLEVPEWLLSKMVKEYHLEDYKVKIVL